MFPIDPRIYEKPDDFDPPATKDLANDINYPNLHCVDYAARPQNMSSRIHDCWDSVTINGENNLVIATNQRSGVKWWGEFFSFDQLHTFSIEKSKFNCRMNSPISKVQYAQNSVLLTGLVDGSVQLWSTYSKAYNPDKKYCLFTTQINNVKHNHPINNLIVCQRKRNQVVTTCTQGIINIWDIESSEIVHTRKLVNVHLIDSVDASHTNDDIFVTCSGIEGLIKLWDLRTPQPAIRFYQNPCIHFTAIAWATPTEMHCDNLIFAGDYDGDIHTLDVRKPKQFINTSKYFQESSIDKIFPEGDYLAVTGNDPGIVCISNANTHNIVYVNKETHNVVRDGVWVDDANFMSVGYGINYDMHKLSIQS